MSETWTLDIASIAAGGDGVARHDGLVVFVPRTAPGDRVVARVEKKGRLARGRVERIETPGPGRVEPECRHYDGDQCGGCQLQHLALDAQRAAKRHVVQDSLRRIARREVPLPEVRGGTQVWEYRRKLSLAIRRSAAGVTAGLHAWDDPDRVFALEECRIADPALIAVWREIVAAERWLPSDARLRGNVRLAEGGASFVLEGSRQWPLHATFAEHVPSVGAIWWVPEGDTRRLLHDRRTHAEPAASFAQVNPEVGAMLTAFVIERTVSFAPVTVVDAYAGAGDVAAALSSRGCRVVAIELDREASAFSATRLGEGSRAIAARVEEALAGALPADVVILNPPRGGVDERVTALLATAAPRPRALLYVSCDPATLARDVSRLAGWRLQAVTAFDMFPQTAHVETVCELVPEGAP